MSGIETSIAPLVDQQVGDDTIAIRDGQIVRSRVQASIAIAARFTGNPAAYVPARADLLVLKTDVEPNQLYRTTGTTAGALILVGGGGLDEDALFEILESLVVDNNGAFVRTVDGSFIKVS